ncbi:MAG TPA: hypothetical protein VK941_07845 [Gillisia sp.]|nr:hypothetical protein [Gillisia sp.]
MTTIGSLTGKLAEKRSDNRYYLSAKNRLFFLPGNGFAMELKEEAMNPHANQFFGV